MTTRRPAAQPAAVTPVATRPITQKDRNVHLVWEVDEAIAGLAQVKSALGSNPVDTLESMSLADLEAITAALRDARSQIEAVQNTVAATQAIRERMAPALPEVFHGEARLEEMKLNVVLTLNKDGTIREIEVLPMGTAPKSLKPNQVHATISASELNKELADAGQVNELEDSAREDFDQSMIKQLLENAWIENNGSGPKKVGNVTPGQISSSRAHLTGGLRAGWLAGRAERAKVRKSQMTS